MAAIAPLDAHNGLAHTKLTAFGSNLMSAHTYSSSSSESGSDEDKKDRVNSSDDLEDDLSGPWEFEENAADSSRQNGLDEDAAPLSSMPLIFEDLTSRALSLGFGEYVQSMASRPLKIATMCSGTESPIFALRLIAEGMYKLF